MEARRNLRLADALGFVCDVESKLIVGFWSPLGLELLARDVGKLADLKEKSLIVNLGCGCGCGWLFF